MVIEAGGPQRVQGMETNHELHWEEIFGTRYLFGGVVKRRQRSCVYCATRVRDGAEVIVKTSHVPDPLQMKGFSDFAKRLCSGALSHHVNIVHTLEADSIPDLHMNYVIMEKINGATLQDHVLANQYTLTVGGLLELLGGSAAGIDALHGQRIVHRDIKPDNIFVDAVTRQAKIGDFEIALNLHEIADSSTHTIFGTPAFIAPEQIIGTSYGPAADIYAFAMTIYVLMTRKSAFDSWGVRELLYAQVHEEPVPLRDRNRSWPVDVEKALRRSLDKKPEKRHESASALAAELSTALRAFTPFRISSYFDGAMSRFSSGEVPINF